MESEGFFFPLDNQKSFSEPDKSPPAGDFFFFLKTDSLSHFQDSFSLQVCANYSTDVLIKKSRSLKQGAKCSGL